MRHLLILAVLLGLPRPPAPTVTVNGQRLPERAVTVRGETYVPLSVLERLGVPLVFTDGGLLLGTGPADGCLGEWLSGGPWRLRVLRVRPLADAPRGGWPGWGVSVEVGNATRQPLSLADVGAAVHLILAGGGRLPAAGGPGWGDGSPAPLPPGGTATLDLRFFPPRRLSPAALRADPPRAFLLGAAPGLRVDLTCRGEGRARADTTGE